MKKIFMSFFVGLSLVFGEIVDPITGRLSFDSYTDLSIEVPGVTFEVVRSYESGTVDTPGVWKFRIDHLPEKITLNGDLGTPESYIVQGDRTFKINDSGEYTIDSGAKFLPVAYDRFVYVYSDQALFTIEFNSDGFPEVYYNFNNQPFLRIEYQDGLPTRFIRLPDNVIVGQIDWDSNLSLPTRVEAKRTNTSQTFTYDWSSSAQLEKIVDPFGNVLSFSYDSKDRLIEWTDSVSAAVHGSNAYMTVEYNTMSGRVERISNGYGPIFSYEFFNSAGDAPFVQRRTDWRGVVEERVYDENWDLEYVKADGILLYASSNLSENVEVVTNDGSNLRKVWSEDGSTLTVTNLKTGHVDRKRFNENGDLVEHIRPDGQILQSEYDSHDRVVLHRNITEDGSVFHVRISYQHPTLLLFDQIDFYGDGLLLEREIYEYDQAGRVKSIRNGEGELTSLEEYDNYNRIVRRLNDGDIMEFSYDDRDDFALKISRSDGFEIVNKRTETGISIGWSKFQDGDLVEDITGTQLVDENGVRTLRRFDSLSNYDVTEKVTLDGLVLESDSDGIKVVYGYDKYGRETSRVYSDGTGGSLVYDPSLLAYNGLGENRVVERRVGDLSIVPIFDDQGRKTGVRKTDLVTGEVIEYGGVFVDDTLRSFKDGLGVEVMLEQPEGGIFEQRAIEAPGTAVARILESSTDDLGLLSAFREPESGYEVQYERNETGLVVDVFRSGLGSAQFDYFDDRNLRFAVRPDSTRYDVERIGESIVRETWTSAEDEIVKVTETTAIEVDGMVKEVVTQSGSLIERSYFDEEGLLSGVSVSEDEAEIYKIEYQYDENYRVSGISGPGFDYSISYDPMGRITAVTDGAGGFYGVVYDGFDEVREYGNGMIVSTDRDAFGRIREVSASDDEGQVLWEESYEYDGVTVSETVGSHGHYVFNSDERGRLSSVEDGLTNATYERLNWSQLDGLTRYESQDEIEEFFLQPGSLLLFDFDGQDDRFAYDGRGNLTRYRTNSGTTWTYVYDIDDSLIEVKRDGETRAKFGYLDSGLRLWKQLPDGSKEYYVYLDHQLVAVLDNDFSVLETYSYHIDEFGDAVKPLWIKKNGNYHYFVLDRMWAPRCLVNENGVLVWQARYNAKSETVLIQDDFPCRLHISNRYFDEESGLYYNIARYFHPDLMRFLTPDPVGEEGGLDLYAYAAGRPHMEVDWTGLYSCPPCGEISLKNYSLNFDTKTKGSPIGALEKFGISKIKFEFKPKFKNRTCYECCDSGPYKDSYAAVVETQFLIASSAKAEITALCKPFLPRFDFMSICMGPVFYITGESNSFGAVKNGGCDDILCATAGLEFSLKLEIYASIIGELKPSKIGVGDKFDAKMLRKLRMLGFRSPVFNAISRWAKRDSWILKVAPSAKFEMGIGGVGKIKSIRFEFPICTDGPRWKEFAFKSLCWEVSPAVKGKLELKWSDRHKFYLEIDNKTVVQDWEEMLGVDYVWEGCVFNNQ